MSLLAPTAAAFGLIVPVIVALYFLKVRRPQVPVSSTLLWRSLTRDRQASVPWQRLRFSWLLVLQLLAAMALVLALMRPAHSTPAPLAAHTILMVDTSAPMQTTDVHPSRFAEARRRAGCVIGSSKTSLFATLQSFKLHEESRSLSPGWGEGSSRCLKPRPRAPPGTLNHVGQG